MSFDVRDGCHLGVECGDVSGVCSGCSKLSRTAKARRSLWFLFSVLNIDVLLGGLFSMLSFFFFYCYFMFWAVYYLCHYA